MRSETDSSDDDWSIELSNLSRRRVIATTAGASLGLAGLAVGATGDASADVSVDDVSVSDASFDAESVDPVIEATIPFAYSVETISEVLIELQVGDSVVADEILNTTTTEADAETTLSGRVVDSDSWSASDFVVSEGQSISREISVSVRLAVLDGGELLVKATGSDTATVEVSHPQQGTASVGLQATIVDGA
jgi:hypothetical protein